MGFTDSLKKLSDPGGVVEKTHSKVFGKPSSEDQEYNQELQKQQSDIAKKLAKMAVSDWNKKQPLSRMLAGQQGDYLKGGLSPSTHPWYGMGQGVAQDQYDVAREQLAGSVQGSESFGEDIDLSQQKNLTDLMGRIAMDEYSKAYSVGANAPAQAYQGMGAAGSQYGQAAGNYNQYLAGQQGQQAQQAQGFGSAIGMSMSK